MASSVEASRDKDDESRRERVNRELIELLNELRVALPGVQVLFAFLLAVPFSNGYTRITDFQKDVFFATLVATAISTAFFIAPSAYHRWHFRNQEKERLLITSNGFALIGILFLAISMVGVVVLITDVIYSEEAAIVSGAVAALLFGGLWAGLPLARRAR
jgi:membrane-bound acyltransferase YfiQ involved in biofilm formation